MISASARASSDQVSFMGSSAIASWVLGLHRHHDCFMGSVIIATWVLVNKLHRCFAGSGGQIEGLSGFFCAVGIAFLLEWTRGEAPRLVLAAALQPPWNYAEENTVSLYTRQLPQIA